MIFGEPQSFDEASNSRLAKRYLPNDLTSAELAELGAEVTEMASFSAGVTDAYILARFDALTAKIAGGADEEDFARRAAAHAAGTTDGPLLLDRAAARVEMKAFLDEIGYRPKPGDEGTIKDLRTDARINLKLRTDVEMAQGFGQYTAGSTPATLDLTPCQELVRVSRRRVPRDWPSRWRQAGGKFFNGRMIAAKSDPVWTKISRFGLPYPPYDYNSGMGTRNVRRTESESLGVIEPGQRVQLPPRRLTDDLQASAAQFSSALQSALLETGYRIENGVLKNRAVPDEPWCTADADPAPDSAVAQAIYAAYAPDDDATWDVSDEERETLNDDELSALAASRFLRAELIVAGVPILNAAHHSKTQFRCPKGTARGGRFARNVGECGGPGATHLTARGLGPTHAQARKAFLADLKAVEGKTGNEYTQALRARLKVKHPELAALHITSVTGATPAERAKIYTHAQEMFDLLPPRIVRAAKEFKVEVVDRPGSGELGHWNQRTRTLVLNRAGGVTQSTIYHEMGHWLHDNGPASFRAAVQAHYAQRTSAEPMQHASGGVSFDFKRDQLYDDYTGREYGGARQGEGTEIVSRHLEHLQDGTNRGFGISAARPLSDLHQTHAYRETASVAMSIFYYGRKRQ